MLVRVVGEVVVAVLVLAMEDEEDDEAIFYLFKKTYVTYSSNLYISKTWSVVIIVATLLLSHIIGHVTIFFLVYKIY